MLFCSERLRHAYFSILSSFKNETIPKVNLLPGKIETCIQEFAFQIEKILKVKRKLNAASYVLQNDTQKAEDARVL